MCDVEQVCFSDTKYDVGSFWIQFILDIYWWWVIVERHKREWDIIKYGFGNGILWFNYYKWKYEKKHWAIISCLGFLSSHGKKVLYPSQTQKGFKDAGNSHFLLWLIDSLNAIYIFVGPYFSGTDSSFWRV